MSDAVSPAAKPKMSPLVRILVVICGIGAIVTGILQMKRGFGEMSGDDPEMKRLLQESDSAFDSAKKHLVEAEPLFTSLGESVRTISPDELRSKRKEDAEKAGELYGKAAELLRTAARKADAAAAHNPGDKMKEFLAAKSMSYRHFADAETVNQEIVRMLLDESIGTREVLGSKIEDAEKRRDALNASGLEASTRADKIAEDAKK